MLCVAIHFYILTILFDSEVITDICINYENNTSIRFKPTGTAKPQYPNGIFEVDLSSVIDGNIRCGI